MNTTKTLPPRSILRLREGHIDPGRQGEIVVEVLRDGEVVAFIYGSREGVHIVSPRLHEAKNNEAFFLGGDIMPMPGYVIPLLADGEQCPWCEGVRIVELQGKRQPCPVCAP